MTDAISILEATHFNWGLQYEHRNKSNLGDKFIDNNGTLYTTVPGWCELCVVNTTVCRGINKPFLCNGSTMVRLEQFDGRCD